MNKSPAWLDIYRKPSKWLKQFDEILFDGGIEKRKSIKINDSNIKRNFLVSKALDGASKDHLKYLEFHYDMHFVLLLFFSVVRTPPEN